MALIPRYTCQPIAALSPGAQNVSFQGLITNITPVQIDSKSSQAVRGCFELLIADESSEIIVRLWHNEKSYEAVRLGQIVKVSTRYVAPTVTSDMTANTIRCLPASIITSVFPEKDKESSIEFLQDSQHHATGLETSLRRTGLMNLENCFQGCAGLKLDVKIVVLVLDVGRPRTVKTTTNTSVQVVDVSVVDSSSLQTSPLVTVSKVCLSFNPPLFSSASNFVPGQTVLFISKPKVVRPTLRKIELAPCSQILIDPSIPETRLLRDWNNCLLAVPPLVALPGDGDGDGDGLIFHHSTRFLETVGKQSRGEIFRRQFTLASFLDEVDLRRQQVAQRRSYWRRFAKDLTLVGYISVIVTRVSLVDLYQSNQLFHGTCSRCRMRVAANTPTADHPCSARISTPSNSTISNSSNSEPVNTVRAAETHKMNLCWNRQLLCGISDETGGLLLHDKEDRHNLQLTDHAVLGLTGLSREDFEEPKCNTKNATNRALWTNKSIIELTRTRGKMQMRLCWIEDRVLWARVTLTLGWANGCAGRRRRGEHENARTQDNELRTGCNEEDVVVLNVSS